MTEEESAILDVLAREEIDKTKRQILEQQAIRPGTRRYSHEEWALFLGCFPQGLYFSTLPTAAAYTQTPQPLFLVYPAREEQGFTLATKLLKSQLTNTPCSTAVHWTELVLSDDLQNPTHKIAKLAKPKELLTQAKRGVCHVLQLISIKADHSEQLRANNLTATVDLWRQTLLGFHAYRHEKKYTTPMRVNLLVLVADTLQAYNELPDVTDKRQLTDAINRRNLRDKWQTYGRAWQAVAETAFAPLRETARTADIELTLQFVSWDTLIAQASQGFGLTQLRDYLEQQSECGQAYVTMATESLDAKQQAQQAFAMATNYKANRHAERFVDDATRATMQQQAAQDLQKTLHTLHAQFNTGDTALQQAINAKKKSKSLPKTQEKSAPLLYGHSNPDAACGGHLVAIKTLLGETENPIPVDLSLPQLPSDFIPRTDLMDKLCRFFASASSFASTKILVCHGHSGAGKTSLALRYLQDSIDHYQHQFWLPSHARHAFTAILAKQLGMNTTEISEQQLRQAIKDKLVQLPGRSLLVFDEMAKNKKKNDFQLVLEYLPATHCDVLITSTQDWPQKTDTAMLRQPLAMSTIDGATARQFFADLATPDQYPTIDNIAQLLNYIPLVLRIASNDMRNNRHITPQQYYEETNQQLTKTKIAKDYHKKNDVYSWQAAATIVCQQSIHRMRIPTQFHIPDTSLFEKTVLCLATVCSHLATSPIPKKLVKEWVISQLTTTSTANALNVLFKLACSQLHAHALLNATEDTLSMHSMVQSAFKQEPALATLIRLSELLAKHVGSFSDMPNDPYCALWLPHIDILLTQLEKIDATASAPTRSRLLFSAGNICCVLGAYTRQQDYLLQALTILEQSADQPRIARTRMNLGNAAHALGDYAAAENYLQQALDYFNQTPLLSEAATAAMNLGGAYLKLGKTAEGLKHLLYALDIFQHLDQRFLPRVAAVSLSLGVAYTNLGCYAEAQQVIERAVFIETQYYGADNPTVALSKVALAGAYLETNRVALAIELLEETKPIIASHYGTTHPKYADALETLGNACSKAGKKAEAVTYLEQALTINKAFYGEQHVVVARNRLNLAIDLGTEKRISARELLQQALSVFERHFGSEHTQVGLALFNLSKLEAEYAVLQSGSDPSHFATASAYLTRAADIFNKTQHPAQDDVAKRQKYIDDMRHVHAAIARGELVLTDDIEDLIQQTTRHAATNQKKTRDGFLSGLKPGFLLFPAVKTAKPVQVTASVTAQSIPIPKK